MNHEGIGAGYKDNFLDFAIIGLDAGVKVQGEIGENVEIIKQIWKVANQKTRDFVCCRAIESFRGFGLYNIPALKTVIQEIEEHKRVMDLDMALRRAIRSLNVDQVKTALENCGEDVESVLTRNVYWSDATDIDCLLIYPLMVDYERNLDKEEFEKIKEITKLLWDKASPDVRNFWLEDHMVNREGQNTEDNYIIGSLEKQQKEYANIAGEGWLEDFIQEVKGYKKDREIKLNEYKGKIALGVVGLCVVGAIAVYVLAYPVVALVLEVSAVSALAVLAYIGGVCEKSESPNTKSLNPVVSGCCNNAELPNQ
ncbi:MAG: hypothetical protein WBIAU1_06360 [Wolbachia endosymbiont of Drosophila biauraria]|nr:MAG: hypothetical protein WBIAU1_06360 [Wolbachia endosymbiont of Drosophila biauraria]